ncbi:DUF6471 domain-containing protein [Sulfurospirillum multivorans]|uniref:DUF6471 domain-containing protein n=1 Tax=Sulfurospirillum multivorans TaxID=66821 RepID=UPI00046D3D46|nr:DUF6471 domain-containing protein [Sulfurospirillum multivorans]
MLEFDKNIPKNLIKAELHRQGLQVKDLVRLLEPYNVKMTDLSFNNKMSRKGFSADFFLKCMDALGVKTLKIRD